MQNSALENSANLNVENKVRKWLKCRIQNKKALVQKKNDEESNNNFKIRWDCEERAKNIM